MRVVGGSAVADSAPRGAPTLDEAESKLAFVAPTLDRGLRLLLAGTLSNPDASPAVLLRVDDALDEVERALLQELEDVRHVRRLFADDAARRAA